MLSVYTANQAWMFVAIILFLFSSMSMNGFFYRINRFKRKEKFVQKNFKLVNELDIVSRLKDDGFTFRKNSFGHVAVKIEGKTCYKVTIVDDVKEYLNPDKDKNDNTSTKGIERCNEFIGFEIFTKDDDKIFEKAPNLSFAGDKVLYESYLLDLEKNMIIEANVIDPLNHKESQLKLQKKIGLEEISE